MASSLLSLTGLTAAEKCAAEREIEIEVDRALQRTDGCDFIESDGGIVVLSDAAFEVSPKAKTTTP